MDERIKKVRSSFNLTQQEFADRLKIKRNTIAKYETNRGKPIDAVVALICREFGVSEEWLRTGEGEMFAGISRAKAMEADLRKIITSGSESFRERMISLLLQLDLNQWRTIEQYTRKLLAEVPAEPAGSPEERARKRAEEYYQRVLQEERDVASGAGEWTKERYLALASEHYDLEKTAAEKSRVQSTVG